jgi:hypothetical protein
MRRSNQLTLSLLLALCTMAVAPTAVFAESTLQPRLWSASWHPESESFRAEGVDPAGPRQLVLWSHRNESFERIAATRSLANGRFDFGEISVAMGPLMLAVSARGQRPLIEELLVIERSIPAPQIVAIPSEANREILVHPARFEGEFRVRDAHDGRLLARLAIEPSRPAATTLDLFELFGASAPESIWIHQVLEDGRQSDRAFFRFDRGNSLETD